MRKIILTTLIVIYYSIMLGQTQAVHFSGTNSSIDVGNSVGNGLRTIECWFRPSVNISSSITDPAYSLVVRNDAEYNEFGLYIIGSDWTVNKGKLAFYVRYNGGINQIHSNVNTWNANTWYHVSGTIDPVNGMKLYIDGIAQTETKPSFKNATTNQTQVTKIGTWGDANLRYFKGDIDEVRFWNRALTSSEVNSKKCCLLNPANETGLVGYWHFEEGTGATTNEVINNSNNTLTNVSWVSSNNCISNLVTWYLDQDHDNYASQTTTSCESPGTGWTTASMPVIDCNDQNAAIYPSQLENYFNSIDDNCDAIIQYQLSANSNSGGTISPNGNMIVTQGANQYYTFTPQSGYYISDVIVDGVSLGAITSYGFNNINASHNITVMFAQVPPTISIVSDDSDNSICNGTPITFNATVTNAGSSPIYQWQINGNNAGSNQSSFTTANLQNNDVITCVVNPGNNSATSNAVSITINANPIASIFAHEPTNACIGSSTMLTANIAPPNMYQDPSNTYSWSTGVNAGYTVVHTTGIITLTVTNPNGCQDTASISIIRNPLPNNAINYPNQVSLCVNKSDSVYVVNPSPNQSYQWLINNGTGYVDIVGETNPKIKIGNGSNINSIGLTSLVVVITNTITNCYSTNWINIIINPQPNVIITSSNGTSLCNGNNTTLSANGASSYVWNNSATTHNINITPQNNTTYAVTGTDANGCIGTSNIQILVNTLPNISITSTNGTTICNGSSTTLTGNGGVSYLWGNGATTSNIIVTPQNNTTYNVTGTDANGCANTAAVTIYTSNACATINPTHCGRTLTNLYGQTMQCVGPVPNATSYIFYFAPVGGGQTVTYTSSTFHMALALATGLQYNTTYNVSVQPMFGNNAGPINMSPCQLILGEPTATILPAHCGRTFTNLYGTSMNCTTPVTYATSYVFYFTPVGGGQTVTYTSSNYYMPLASVVSLQYNTTYNVSVQAIVGNYAGPISTSPCQLIMGEPTATILPAHCGRTFTNLYGTSMNCTTPVTYATSYVFYFAPVGGGQTVTYTSSNYYMPLASVVSLQYNTTYNVSVQAIVGNYAGPISTSPCQLIMGEPTATILPAHCGRTFTNLYGTSMNCTTPVTYATSYVFYFAPVGGGQTVTYTSNNYYMPLASVVSLQYNTTYNVSVQAIVGNYAGPISTSPCQLIMGEPTAIILPAHCGRTFTNLYGTSMNCTTPVTYATSYVFYFAPVGGGQTVTYTSNTYYMSLASAVGLQYNTTYNVSVQAIVGNYAGPISTSPCQLIMGEPIATILPSHCGRTITNLSGQTVRCNTSVTNATSYVFYFTPVGGGQTLSYTSNIYYMPLASVAGIQYNTTYNVSVQAIVGSYAGPISTVQCLLAIGSGSRIGNFETTEGEVISNKGFKLFPNPASNEVNITLSENTQAHITIFDSQGKSVKKETIADYNAKIDLDGISEGIYFIHIIQNGNTYKEKLIKN